MVIDDQLNFYEHAWKVENGQGKLEFGQGKVRELSGNFIFAVLWEPCTSMLRFANLSRSYGPWIFFHIVFLYRHSLNFVPTISQQPLLGITPNFTERFTTKRRCAYY